MEHVRTATAGGLSAVLPPHPASEAIVAPARITQANRAAYMLRRYRSVPHPRTTGIIAGGPGRADGFRFASPDAESSSVVSVAGVATNRKSCDRAGHCGSSITRHSQWTAWLGSQHVGP
jgi:hypothetical protein